jgi:hypothetical protein
MPRTIEPRSSGRQSACHDKYMPCEMVVRRPLSPEEGNAACSSDACCQKPGTSCLGGWESEMLSHNSRPMVCAPISFRMSLRLQVLYSARACSMVSKKQILSPNHMTKMNRTRTTTCAIRSRPGRRKTWHQALGSLRGFAVLTQAVAHNSIQDTFLACRIYTRRPDTGILFDHLLR